MPKTCSTKFDHLFQRFSAEFFGPEFDWKWFKAQAIAESGLDPLAVSAAGATGIMQMMPATYAEMTKRIGLPADPHTATLIYDPLTNIRCGIAYDRRCFDIWQKEIVHDAGGIVLSTLDGNLLIVAEEETPVPDWPQATPAQTIHAVLERISTSESKDEQKGYNCFDVSDQLASGETFRFEEERIDGRTKELRLFLVPLDPERRFVITHSSDNQVTVEPFGIVSLQIRDELVEFREGSGRTNKPIYGLSSVVWQKENLGGVTFSEDGILTSTVSGYSLLKVSYVTKYFKWIVRDPRIEDVQFRAVEVTA
jgi:hypothetical protein